ncbi:hypothetical protein BDF19DRAFT_449168 [Syncephalis fuscata]|nr:hypothetical protein BDF19DRAFT_449168 [Syncephalis fuscata]
MLFIYLPIVMSSVKEFATKSGGERILRRANPAQIRVSWENVVQQWGQGVTREQFLEREQLLSQQPGFSGDKMGIWLLVPASDPETLEPLAQCETFDRSGVLAIPGDNGASPTVKEVRCWSIAGVFTSEKFRHRGYASELMALLRQKAEETGIVLSTLVSDVGPHFYARFGWQVYPSLEIAFPATTPAITKMLDQSNVIELFENDFAKFAAAEASEMQAKAIALIKQSDDQRPVAFITPSEANYKWHWARTSFYAQISNMSPVPKVVGAAVNDPAVDPARNHIIWSHDVPKKTTRVLRFCCETLEIGQLLIAAAQREAHHLNLDQVILWLSEEDSQETSVLRQLPCGQVSERDGCLPSMAWFDDPSALQLDATTKLKPRWIACERYTWT